MGTVSTTFHKVTSASETTRKCLVTGVVRPKPELIRFALDPDDHVVPDLAARLPGRGLWVTASRDALDAATRKNMFARAAKKPAKVDAGLPDLVARLLEKRCLELLGLARGAGLVITGQPQVEQAVKSRELAFVMAADDAGADGLKKLYHATILQSGFTRAQLGATLGREQLVYLGLKPHALTEKLRNELARWQGVRAESSTSSHITLEAL